MRKPLSLLLPVLLAAAALSGCPTDELAGGDGSVRRASPKPSATPGSSGDVNGGIEPAGSEVGSVRSVSITPDSASLNAPADDGASPAGLSTGRTFTAQVITSNGGVDERGVTWTVSDPAALDVRAGAVTVKPRTAAGSYVVTATAVGDPSVSGTALVHVARDGLLRLALEPAPSPSVQLTLNLVRNGEFVLNQPFANRADLRLPAGTGYDAQIQQTDESMTLLATFSALAITPNGITIATASLQATGR